MSRALRRSIAALGLTTSVLLPAPASAQARRPMALEDLITAVRVERPAAVTGRAARALRAHDHRPRLRQAQRRHLDGAGRRLGAAATVHRRPEERRLAALSLQRPHRVRLDARWRAAALRRRWRGQERASHHDRSAPACRRRSSCPPTDAWSRSCPTRIRAAATKRATPARATRWRRIPSRCTR